MPMVLDRQKYSIGLTKFIFSGAMFHCYLSAILANRPHLVPCFLLLVFFYGAVAAADFAEIYRSPSAINGMLLGSEKKGKGGMYYMAAV